MSKAKATTELDTKEFDNFQDLTRKLIAVPKKEIDREAVKHARKKEKAKGK
jgi:hypothetical protein